VKESEDGKPESRVSQPMVDYMKKINGDRLKKIMQNGIRASRFTTLSKNFSNLSGLASSGNKNKDTPVREPTIIGQLSKNSNFDYLGLRDDTNKLYKRVSLFLEKNGEKKHSLSIFTDYMYKISSNF
jgi:protein involved in ribonucleotide reduction